jgi:hypothetical protein
VTTKIDMIREFDKNKMCYSQLHEKLSSYCVFDDVNLAFFNQTNANLIKKTKYYT